jgi:RNA-directed DNA polymerase
MSKKKTLYSEVHDIQTLKKAWTQIYENSLTSASEKTKSSVQEFKLNEHANLYKIRLELRKGKFSFDGVKGIGVKKAKKKGAPRPVVLSPPVIRVVQRSILDVLQNKPQVKKFLDVPYSFGAIRSKGVPNAIHAVVDAIKNGATHYIKSDIASFFTRIERSKVINILSESFVGQQQFIDLIEQATNLEVQNLVELEKRYGIDFKQLFIFADVGTPQGCCLSPLFGNILLYDFDMAMNSGDIICLRYLDDLIILGPSLRAVKAAFRKAIELLSSLGLEAYDPEKDKNKACQGSLEKPFEFLGVEFHGKNIRPAAKARSKLLKEIDDLISESIALNFSSIMNGSQEDRSLVKTLYQMHNKVKGWGNQYYFCNDKAVWGSLDSEIDMRIRKYLDHHFATMRRLDEQQQRRRQLGVHLLVDSKSEPIIW